MSDSRIHQFVPLKKVDTDITPKVTNDAIGFQRLKPEINVETLAATRTLLTTDYMSQWLDPNGSDRDVVLPAEASSTDLLFIILNTANATAEDLVIKNDGGTTITTIGPEQSAILTCDGTNWKLENDVGMYYDGQASTSQAGHIFAGGVVVEDYLTVGAASLQTSYPLYVNGNCRSATHYIVGGNLFVYTSGYGITTGDNNATLLANIPVTGTDAIDHKIKLQIDSNDIFAVLGTGQGDGTAAAFKALLEQNDMWLAELNYAETDYINMFKVNVDDEIDVGGTMNLGSIEGPEDGGAITLFDMPVSATPADGDEESVTMKLDGDNMFKLYSEADSAGGVDTHQFQPLRPVVYAQAVQVLTGAGAVDIVSQITHIVTTGVDALSLVDGAEGQEKFIVMKTDANDGTLTPDNLGNGNTITFDDVGDSAHLLFTNGAWHFMGGTATLA